MFLFFLYTFLDFPKFLKHMLLLCVCVYVCVFLPFLGPHPWHMEVPRLGVESDPQPQAYARATAMPDPSCLCDLHHSSPQHRILNPLSKARDQTCILMGTSQVCNSLSHNRNSVSLSFKIYLIFGYAHSMWKFPGQGLIPSHSNDSAGSLTRCSTGKLCQFTFLITTHLY